MKVKYFFLFSIYFFPLCVFAKDFVPPKGHIIFANGNAIYDMNFTNFKKIKIYEETQGSLFKLTKLNPDSFLFSSYSDKGVYIKLFDLKNKTAQLLFDGNSPVYVSSVKKILFYFVPSVKEGDGLYEMGFKDGALSKPQRIVNGCIGSTCENVVEVSNGNVVVTDPYKTGKLLLINLTKLSVSELPISNCAFPILWRDKTNQLMCDDANSGDYFFVDLNGKQQEKLPINKNTNIPMLYISETDQMLLRIEETKWFSEHYDLWLYDFKTDKKILLAKNIVSNTGDAVYYPN